MTIDAALPVGGTLLVIVLSFSVIPYVVFWVTVRIWPKGHSRRFEFEGEIDHVDWWNLPIWVGGVAIRSVLDGSAARLAERRSVPGATQTSLRAVVGRILRRRPHRMSQISITDNNGQTWVFREMNGDALSIVDFEPGSDGGLVPTRGGIQVLRLGPEEAPTSSPSPDARQTRGTWRAGRSPAGHRTPRSGPRR